MANGDLTEEESEALDSFLTDAVLPFIRPGQCETAIKRLRERFEIERKAEARALLLRRMATPLWMIGKHEDAIAVLRQCTELRPDDPLNWCALSHTHSLREQDSQPDSQSLKNALATIDIAVETARRIGALVRYCLNARCRIAVEMRRYDLLEETLREILALPAHPRIPDIGLEDDFLRHLPADAIDPNLLAAYRAAVAEQEAGRAEPSPPAEP